MSRINAIITGVGGYVPEYVLTNEELSRMVDTNDEWIMTRVGIKERRILTEEGLGTSYMARKAAKQLIQKTGVDPDTIDALVVATSTADYKFPSTASIVVGKLGLKNAYAFDFWAACCGFLYALDQAAMMIQSGRVKRMIVIGADKISSIVDYKDRQTCPLFGDGAAAVLLEATEEQKQIILDYIISHDLSPINDGVYSFFPNQGFFPDESQLSFAITVEVPCVSADHRLVFSKDRTVLGVKWNVAEAVGSYYKLEDAEQLAPIFDFAEQYAAGEVY